MNHVVGVITGNGSRWRASWSAIPFDWGCHCLIVCTLEWCYWCHSIYIRRCDMWWLDEDGYGTTNDITKSINWITWNWSTKDTGLHFWAKSGRLIFYVDLIWSIASKLLVTNTSVTQETITLGHSCHLRQEDGKNVTWKTGARKVMLRHWRRKRNWKTLGEEQGRTTASLNFHSFRRSFSRSFSRSVSFAKEVPPKQASFDNKVTDLRLFS